MVRTRINEYVDRGVDCFVKLFRDKITYTLEDGDEYYLPIITEYYPEPVLPSLVIESQPSLGLEERMVVSLDSPLSEEHPYYDPCNPYEEYPQTERYININHVRLQLNFYAQTTNLVDEILSKGRRLIDMGETNHYIQCYNYNNTDGTCITSNADCDAIHSMNRYGVQGKCPYPHVTDPDSFEYRNPCSIIQAYGIISGSFKAKNPFKLDNTVGAMIIHRRIWEIDFLIEEGYNLPLNPVMDMIIEDQTDDGV